MSWNDAKLHVVDDQGVELPGWPKTVNPFNEITVNPLGSVCLADVDADGDMEIFCEVMKSLFAWHLDGTELRDGDSNPATDGILVLSGDNFSYGTPTIANIDTDPYREIIAGMRDGKLYVLRHDGTPYPGFPFVTGGDITTGPAVGDIDNDGRVEIVFGSGIDSKVYAIRSDMTSAAGFPVGIQLQAGRRFLAGPGRRHQRRVSGRGDRGIQRQPLPLPRQRRHDPHRMAGGDQG